MKAALVVFVVVAFWTTVDALTRSDRKQDRLLGSVQSVSTAVAEFTTNDGRNVEGPQMPVQTVTYDAHGNRVKRIDFNRDGSVAQTLIYAYDAEGRATGYEDYTPGLSTPRKHVYVLDQNGYRAEYGIIQPTGSAADEKYVYKYDNNGNRVAEALYHKTALVSRNENAYDDQGRLISQVIYNPDGTVSARSRISYDPAGKLLERIRHDGDLLTYKVRYTYDSKGRLTELETVGSYVEIDSNSEGYVTGKVVYVYKGKDYPKEALTYNQDGSLRDKVVFEYDSTGNWIKRTRRVRSATTRKEVPVHVEYRTITYN